MALQNHTNHTTEQRVKCTTCTAEEHTAKELFDMVYAWGYAGIVVDQNAPAYRSTVKKLLKIIQTQKGEIHYGRK